MAGWVKIWDIPEGHWLNSDLRYFGAWVRLIRKAEIRDHKIVRHGTMFDAKRGSVYTSCNELAGEWGVTRRMVDNFLGMCEADGMVTVQRMGNRGIIVNISNYAKFQGRGGNRCATDGATDGATDSTTDDATDDATDGVFFLTNAEGTEYTEHTEVQAGPSLEEVGEYVRSNGLKVNVLRFFQQYASAGWKTNGTPIRDWRALLRAWDRKDKERSAPRPHRFNNFEQRPGGYEDLERAFERGAI